MLAPLLFSALFAAASETQPSLVVDGCNIGDTYAFAEAKCSVRIRNNDDAPVTVELTMQAHDSVEPAKLTVAPHTSANADVTVRIGNNVGRISRGLHAHPDHGKDAYVFVEGFAMTALDEARPQIDWGIVKPASSRERTISLSSNETPAFRITKILERPDGVEASVLEDGHTLQVRLPDDAPWGIVDGDIKLAIDTPHQHEVWVHVSGDIQGDVTAETNPYWFGNVPAGSNRSILIPLTNRTGRDFKIGDIKLDMIRGKADVVPCATPAAFCKAIRVTFDDTQSAGLTRAKLDVALPEFGRHLRLRIWGLLAGSGKVAESKAKMPMPQSDDFSAPWTEGIVDSVNAPVYALPTADPLDVVGGPAPPTEPPPGNGPLLKWNIAGEQGAYGYQIFRADAEAGPFVLQNDKIIRVHANEYASTPYFWRDARVTSGKKYWYYIGVVYKDGHKQVLSQPHGILAK